VAFASERERDLSLPVELKGPDVELPHEQHAVQHVVRSIGVQRLRTVQRCRSFPNS
jgi:hypothetical protein